MNTFRELYKQLGLLGAQDKELPLHLNCANRGYCWAGAESRFPPDGADSSWISQPWVGPEYRILELAAIGVNMNEYGGLDALTELAEEAKDLITDGYRRVRFHASYEEYAGSFLWHRLGAYSAAIGEAFDTIEVEWGKDGYPVAQSVAKAFDMISFTNHVKCSPQGDKSKPTPAMWDRCGSHVLRKELALLRPSKLLVLGNSDNAGYLSGRVFDSRIEGHTKHGSVACASGVVGGMRVQLFIVPHPTSYGGASNTILTDLKKMLHRTRRCS